MSIFFPSPLVGEGGASRNEATGEGFLPLGELCENVLQNGRSLLQHVIVPITRDPETFGHQDGISRCISFRQCVLTAIDFDNDALFETDEVENKVLKGDLATKFEERKPSIAEQAPHGCLSVGRFATHPLCEIADAFGGRPMVWRLRHEPLTRRLRRHPLPQGEREILTPASASARRARPWNPCPAPASANRGRPVLVPRPRPRSGPRCPGDSAN